MKRLSIKTSLISVFAGIGILFGISAVVGHTGLSATNGSTVDIATNWLPSINAVNAMNTATSDFRIAQAAHIMSTADDQMTKAEADMKAVSDNLTSLGKTYEPLISSDEERKLYDTFSSEWASYLTDSEKLIGMSRANKNDEASALFKGGMRTSFDKASAILQQIVDLNGKGAAVAFEQSQSAYSSTKMMTMLVLGVVTLALSASVAFAIYSISKPIDVITASMLNLAGGDTDTAIPYRGRADEIGAMASAVEVFRVTTESRGLELEAEAKRQAAEVHSNLDRERMNAKAAEEMRAATSGLAIGLKQLAAGNLSFELTDAFSSDFDALRQDFNASVSQLRDALASVSQSVVSINSGSQEISSGTNDLARRTEQQAAALEETAAALEEITANVTSSSARAEEAREVAKQANLSATKSGEVVAQAVSAMSRIEDSSNKISSIIGVIDEIAFQTNLLALNAGVEAARAGEAGRGFAVVAQEVRELAQRSASAAREIKQLIQTSSTEVSTGVKLVSETGDSLKMIRDFVSNINGHMQAIATSVKEQSTGLAEVNQAVNQMDQTTQQNAAMVEESSAAASTMASEANNLRQLIEQFDLGQTARMEQGHRRAA
jgi:methyl-accepting chemotaxis protein